MQSRVREHARKNPYYRVDTNNNGRNGSFFNMAGYLIEERRRWPVITASPRGQCSKYIQNLGGKACSDGETWGG